jgi:hypothetical protein
MLRFGSLRTNGARSAEAVPMKSHGFSVGALLFYLDQPNACESARGPDADRRAKLLICQAMEGSILGSDSHLMILLPSLGSPTGESAPCEPVFESRRLCRVGWLSRA